MLTDEDVEKLKLWIKKEGENDDYYYHGTVMEDRLIDKIDEIQEKTKAKAITVKELRDAFCNAT